MRFRCPHCRFSCLSEYRIGRQEKSKVRMPHRLTFWLNSAARDGLVDYLQAARYTDAQAVRAIFRHALTGKVFPMYGGTSLRGRLLQRVERDPVAAATQFPNLHRETARQMRPPGALTGGRFRPTILGVQRISVMLDDAAKEGLVYAMRRLGMNHADAARWLLTKAEVPDRKLIPPPSSPLSRQKGRGGSS